MRRAVVLALLLAACSDSKPLDPQVQILLSQDPVKAPAALAALAKRQGLPAGAVLHFFAEGADITRTRLTATRMGRQILVTISHTTALRLLLLDLGGTIVDRAGVAAESGELAAGLVVSGGKGAWTIFELRGESRLYRRAVAVRLTIENGQFRVIEPSIAAADAVLDDPFLPITALPRDPAASPYADRFGKRADSPRTRALHRALAWLAREWPSRSSWDIAARGHSIGVQGLAVLAFLRAGFTPVSTDDFDGTRAGDIVRSGLRGLIEVQDAEGCIADRSCHSFIYSHMIATQALCEAWATAGLPVYRGPAARAVEFLLAAQNPGAGFRNTVRPGDNDTSSTGWGFLALRAARTAGFAVPDEAWKGLLAWVDVATDDDGRTGYARRGEFNSEHDGMTAVANMIRRHAGVPVRGTARLIQDMPAWSEQPMDATYFHFGAEAVTDPAWQAALDRALLAGQRRDGSWPADRWAGAGGEACTTAIYAALLARRIPS